MMCKICKEEMYYDYGNEYAETYICYPCNILARRNVEIIEAVTWYAEIKSNNS